VVDVTGQKQAPLGHSKSAHHFHGWCSHCPDHTVEQELAAWRGWAFTKLHDQPASDEGR
jgi:hypothetical protein